MTLTPKPLDQQVMVITGAPRNTDGALYQAGGSGHVRGSGGVSP